MKRFTKMLALGMAMALTFGMTVSANGYEGHPVVNPSTSVGEEVIFVEAESENVYKKNEMSAERIAAVKEASHGAATMNAIASKFGAVYVTYMGEPVDYSVLGNAHMVTRNIVEPQDGYGYVYGYALVHYKNGDLDAPEVVDLGWDKNRECYATTLTGGSPYRLFCWQLKPHFSIFRGIKYSTDTWQNEHMAARKALEVDGNGDTVAQHYKNGDYKFVETIDSVNFNLPSDSNVQFNVPDINGDYEYIVVCYNDTRNIKGYPDRHFGMTRVGENQYTANLPKGSYTAVVIKVTNVPGSAPVNPAPIDTPTAEVAAGAQVGTQTSGVVSPKTGEALPMAVILAAICLAGAAVCAKKARCNG